MFTVGRSTQVLWRSQIERSDIETSEMIITSNTGMKAEMREDEYKGC